MTKNEKIMGAYATRMMAVYCECDTELGFNISYRKDDDNGSPWINAYLSKSVGDDYRHVNFDLYSFRSEEENDLQIERFKMALENFDAVYAADKRAERLETEKRDLELKLIDLKAAAKATADEAATGSTDGGDVTPF